MHYNTRITVEIANGMTSTQLHSYDDPVICLVNYRGQKRLSTGTQFGYDRADFYTFLFPAGKAFGYIRTSAGVSKKLTAGTRITYADRYHVVTEINPTVEESTGRLGQVEVQTTLSGKVAAATTTTVDERDRSNANLGIEVDIRNTPPRERIRGGV